MPLSKIVSKDIVSWSSLDDIAQTLEKRGLKKLEIPDSPSNEIVMQLSDDKFIAIVRTEEGKTESDYRKRMSSTRHTQLVSTNDFKEFTFVTRRRTWDEHGRIKYQKFSFEKSQFEGRGERRTTLEKLNELEYGKPKSVDQLYDTKQVVKEFYDQFEEIRAKMVQEVTGIPDDRGEAKQNYAQTIFNRLIFLYFIQEKNLLDYNKKYLREQNDEIVDEGEDVYEEFYKPLFFDKLAKKTSYDMKFGSLPYLNGGLFTRSEIEEEFPDVRLGDTTEETNELYGEILDFLGDWNWYADERLDIVEPKHLSPEVLGHIFEKTVNQKEMGAYYTPEEITHFMARNTIHPYILDRINEEFDKDYEDIDEVFKIDEISQEEDEKDIKIGSIDDIERDEIEHLYFEVLKNIKVLDPAVGSGAFLLAAQDILLDVYLSSIEYFRRLDEKEPWEMTGQITDLLEKLEGEEESSKKSISKFIKREIILNNLYGVDIDKGATEICKLRLWLSMVADMEEGDEIKEVEALPNIDFNIRQGNSLIGYTEPVQKALFDTVDNDQTATSLDHFNEDSIANRYEEIIEAIEEHKNATSSEEAKKWKRVADEKLEEYREEPDESVYKEFKSNVDEDITLEEVKNYSPFHWILEFAGVYSEGGFDVIIGNPPWDRVKPTRDDYFSKFDDIFRKRPPREKDKKQEKLLSNEKIAQGWEKYKKNIDRKASFFKNSQAFKFQKPKVDGRKKPNPNDLSCLFLERVLHLAKDNTYFSQVLPGLIFNSAMAKDLRIQLLEETEINSLSIFENRGIFEDLHQQYKFGILVSQNSGNTNQILGKYNEGDTKILKNFKKESIKIENKILKSYSPETHSFPYIQSQQEKKVLKKIIQNPPLRKEIEDKWYITPYQGLRKTNISDRLVEKENADYPIYGGSNIYQYIYTPDFVEGLETPELWSIEEEKDPKRSAKRRLKEKTIKDLKKRIYEEFDGSGSQKKFVNELLEKHRGEPLSLDDVLLDCNDYRIVIRGISNSTNERTMISAVIPKEIICHNSLRAVRNFSIEPKNEGLSDYPLHNFYKKKFSDKELFLATGLLNSLPFDFIMRTKIDTNVLSYKIKESQVPRLTNGDDWFNYIWTRAAKLNCYGDDFKEMRERLGGIEAETDIEKRKELQAEIDAAAFHAYGLERNETEYVLDDFHRVENPRMMTEDYFDMVLEKYDELAEKGPME